MRMEEIIWFLWLYCLCFTSAYWTPTYTTETPSQTTETFLCGNGSHVITSPGYPSGYGNNVDVRWSFSTYPGSLLSIEFYDFNLETGWDYVYILSDGEQIAYYTGTQLPPITVSTSNNLTVVFTTDGSVTARGFQAEIFVYPEESDGFCSDFDNGWCGWNHTYGYNQWRRSSERIYGADRGNRYSSSDDHYIYIESRYGGYNVYGYLDSPMIPESWSDVCLKFYYYMSGESHNYLQIYKYDNYYAYSLLYIYDDYSYQWKYASVNFNKTSDSFVRIKGRVYQSYYSTEMVAVDDIYISEGRCSDIYEEINTTPETDFTTEIVSTTQGNDLGSKTDVVCSGSYMTVYLDASIENVDNVHFIDSTCTAAGYVYRNGIQWIYLYTRYDQCQTSITSTETSTTYHNQIIVTKDSTSVIYREDDLRINIQCQLDNRGRSSVNFDPVVQDYFKREHGNFTFAMELYTNDDYSTPYPYYEYPVELSLGSTVYVGASVQTFSDDMILFVDSCKATPNPDPDVNPQYQLIENSCGVDSTVQFDGQPTSGDTSRVLFSFKAFGFNGDYSTVFVHCQLSICNGSDWQCYRNCQQRQRRDVSAPDKLSDTIPIVLGPVILKKSGDDSEVVFETEGSASKGIFPAFSSTLFFAVGLVVLAVGCALWVKGRANSRIVYQKLANNVEEM